VADAARTYGYSPANLRLTLAAAKVAYEVFQIPDGRAAVLARETGAASGDQIIPASSGVYTVTKTAGQVFLDGCELWWDHSENKAIFAPGNDRDFYLGTCVGDAESADTSCVVNLNERPRYEIDSRLGVWTSEATLGEGVTVLPGGGLKLSFDAVAEVAQAAVYSEKTRHVNANGILEARVAVFDKGDNAALDIDIGLASASHASDFEAIPIFVAFHLDGNALDLKAHSDDGTTDVAIVDTTIDLVDDTYAVLWIDTRDLTSVKLYVNAVRVASGATFNWAAATGEVKPIVLIEKTNDDTPADVRVDYLRYRTSEQ